MKPYAAFNVFDLCPIIACITARLPKLKGIKQENPRNAIKHDNFLARYQKLPLQLIA